MNKLKALFALLPLIGLISCSTVPVTDQNSKLVPMDRIYKAEYFKPKDDSGRVEILRDKGFFGAGCTHDIYINNEKIFAIRSNEHATVYLKPDSYIFRLETGGMCPNIATSQDAELKPNGFLQYRISLPSDGSLRLVRLR